MVCPVCLKEYSEEVQPHMLFPCGHGLCGVCLELVREHHSNKCPLCRVDIAADCPNYDFRALLQSNAEGASVSDVAWKSELLESISRHTSQRVVIHDSLEHVSPLLVFWCHWRGPDVDRLDLLAFRSVIARLVLHKTPTEIYDWLGVLRLDMTPALMHAAQELMSARRFLETQDALWVLSMVNSLPTHEVEIELF